MRMPKFHLLDSAKPGLPKETSFACDSLPIRESGSWAQDKHLYLTYYSSIFNAAMQSRWANRVYIEYFSGPGMCQIRGTNQEIQGSALKILEQDFTRFIFIEISTPLAEALRDRIKKHPKRHLVEIWAGDCNDALDRITLPQNSLSLAFIDPTRVKHCPFELIEKTRRKSSRIDLLINMPSGMDIKRNIQNYLKQEGPDAHLTRYLNSEEWRSIPGHDPGFFCHKIFSIFEQQLRALDWAYIGKQQQIVRDDGLPLYYLFFASGSSLGKKFWDQTLHQCCHRELF